MILDTSFIIDYIRGDKLAKEKFEELNSSETQVILTPVNAYELYKGAEKYYRTDEEVKKIEEAVRKIPGEKVPVSWEDGKQTAEIESELKDSGNKIELLDIMIASIAKEKNQTVLTANPEHFKRIDGVEVEGY